MQRHLNKITALAFSGFVSTAGIAHADATNVDIPNMELLAIDTELLVDAKQNPTPPMQKTNVTKPKKVPEKAINPSTNPQNPKGTGYFLTGDWLVWKSNESGLGYAIKSNTSAVSTLFIGIPNMQPVIDGHVKDPEMSWQPGFRLGVGYNTRHNGWDVYLNWICFDDGANNSSSAYNGSNHYLFPIITDPSAIATVGAPFVEKAHASWKLHLNLLDLELGREFFTSPWLTLRPNFGLRSAWITQRYNVDYEGFHTGNYTVKFNSLDVDMENRFWGLGIRGGLNTDWMLGRGWSIYGNLDISLLYGFFDLDRESTYSDDFLTLFRQNPDQLTYGSKTHEFYHATRAITDLQLGLRWDKTFLRDTYHISLQAGWEHHLFFSQNQFIKYVDDGSKTLVSNQGDLGIQGWMLSGRFDF